MATQLRRNSDCSEAEWTARQDLAACYRIFDMLGWSESIYNHITVRVPGEEAFLINPFGLLWSEVTASQPGQDRQRRQQAVRQPLSGQPGRLHPAFGVPQAAAVGARDRPHPYARHDGGVRERGRPDADQLLFLLLRRRDRLSRFRGHHRAARGRRAADPEHRQQAGADAAQPWPGGHGADAAGDVPAATTCCSAPARSRSRPARSASRSPCRPK